MRLRLEQTELNFNRLSHGSRLAVRTASRREAPGTNGGDRFFVEAQAHSFHHLNVGGFGFRGDRGDQIHGALVLRLDGFVRIFRLWAVHAGRHAVAAGSRTRNAAARAVTFARSEASAIAAADAGAVARSDSVAAATAVGFVEYLAERVAPILGVRLLQVQIRRTEQ